MSLKCAPVAVAFFSCLLPVVVFAGTVDISSSDPDPKLAVLPAQFLSVLRSNGVKEGIRPKGRDREEVRIYCAFGFQNGSLEAPSESPSTFGLDCRLWMMGDERPLKNSKSFARSVGALESALEEGPRSLGFTECEKNVCHLIVEDIACEEKRELSPSTGRFRCVLDNGE